MSLLWDGAAVGAGREAIRRGRIVAGREIDSCRRAPSNLEQWSPSSPDRLVTRIPVLALLLEM